MTTLQLVLRKLGSTGTFMQTNAHPDDEDNGLLAMLGLGQGMRTVLVTATRGDGGQNEIGPELFQSLGVLRTEELLGAHRFDGAEQFFTRAVDFGFSFSVEESIEKWGHDEILGDYVRHVRMVRPDVIAGFLCGGEGGGQHHQASTRLTLEAFRAAADPARFPGQIAEGLRPWQAKRVFCTDIGSFAKAASQAPASPDLLKVNVGGFDPLLGRSYSDLGIEARSMHKCQGTSQLLPLPGQSFNRTYRLRDTVIGAPGVAPATFFDGIDTTIPGLATFAGSRPPSVLTSGLATIAAAVAKASTALGSAPGAAAAPLAKGLAAVRSLRAQLRSLDLSAEARYEIDLRLARKEDQFQEAMVLAYGIRFEALADDGVVIRDQPLNVSFAVANNGPGDVTIAGIDIQGLAGASATCTALVRKASAFTCTAAARIPAAAAITGPYWTPRQDAARYDFEAGAPFGRAFRPSPFEATLRLSIGAAEVRVVRPLQFRYDTVVAGEKRMELSVVPAFSVRLSPEIIVFPASTAVSGGGGRTRDVQVVVINHHKGAAKGTVALSVPQGWTVTPAAAPVTFAREDEEMSIQFAVSAPAAAGRGDFAVTAGVNDGSVTHETGYEVVEYPHTQRRHVPKPATANVKVIDVSVAPGVRVGYIMGVGDQVPQALTQLGVSVDLVTPAQLASGDLSQYSVIVTGVRAYERRPDLRANNHRLIAYAENGGTVLVQYNKFEFNEAQYGPYPAKVSAGRVTDENAPIEVLAPSDPVFATPNRLGPETWAGWVQERGLYFLGERDPRYVDLLQASDPFEYNRGVKTGALVRPGSAKGAGSTSGLGCGGSCRPARSARTA